MKVARPVLWALGALACAVALAAIAAGAPMPPPIAQAVAPGVWLIPGSFARGRQPDGNTIVFAGEAGLVVMDTGRHAAHRQAILEFARERGQPIVAIVNSHWHLDHTSGNAAIKREFPQARLYTGIAVDKMIRDIWPADIADSQAFLDSGKAPPGVADDIRIDIETRRDPAALRPDVAVTKSGPETLAGLALELHLAPNAATDTDVWVYEPSTRVAAVGDLVTLPVPFLDTACIRGWRTALAEVEATPFITVIPGHGAPMDRARFVTYRRAFEAYSSCAASGADKAACAAGWLQATATLRAPEAATDTRANQMAMDYVQFLREHGGNGIRCAAP